MNSSNNTTTTKVRCYHCGETCTDARIYIDEKPFCCSGCKTVYEILNQNQLCTYYKLNQYPGNQHPKPQRKERFAYLDKEEVVEALLSYSDETQSHVTFSVPQIHCSSCLWLLENLNTVNPAIVTARVNFTRKEVFIVFNSKKASLRTVVEAMASVGYEPYLAASHTQKPIGKKYSRLTEIAIAGFCFTNIMMLSLPEYFSIGSYLQHTVGAAFRYISFILALPVFFFCSREFFKSAYSSIKNKYLNIDCSIAIAILLTFVRSLFNLFVLNGNTYFDSMSGIVFFMLVGRLAQDRTRQSLLFNRDYKSFFPIAVNVVGKANTKPVLIGELKEQDIIEVYDQEIIPADGILVKGKAIIDYSFVTGESFPRPLQTGALLYAGGKQLGQRIEVLVVKKTDQGYLTNLWNKDANTETVNARMLHKISNYFTIVVLTLTMAAAIFWLLKGQYNTMWNALTTTLIVACPCALLLASAFTNGNIMRILNSAGLFLKNTDVITSLAKVNHIVLDKTGTLTLNNNFSIKYYGEKLSPYYQGLIASLAQHSTHPLSKAIYNHLKTQSLITVDGYKNIPGAGIEGWLDNCHVKIGSKSFVDGEGAASNITASSSVFVWIDGNVPGFFQCENVYRHGTKSMLMRLSEKFRLSIISGDSNAEHSRLKTMTETGTIIKFNQSPEDKYNYVSNLQNAGSTVLMAGDGLNDAGALRKSNVGIAVMEGHSSLTPASDGIINAEAIIQLDSMIAFARTAHHIIISSFIVSIFYNIIGLYFALQGLLQPVIAAILMPASTISIIIITFLMAEFYGRRLSKEKT